LQQVQMPVLSTREREVATLVADGLTTKEIATRLGLSARTVEGHISRALQKTGSATRLELTALFRRS
jgi:DNA-binding CsgD family transcriptional regulator